MKSWLVNRDPYNGLFKSPYNWVVFHPLYTTNNQGFFRGSYDLSPNHQPATRRLLHDDAPNLCKITKFLAHLRSTNLNHRTKQRFLRGNFVLKHALNNGRLQKKYLKKNKKKSTSWWLNPPF